MVWLVGLGAFGGLDSEGITENDVGIGILGALPPRPPKTPPKATFTPQGLIKGNQCLIVP